MTTWRRHRTTVDSVVSQILGVETLVTLISLEGHCVRCGDPSDVAILPGTVIDGPGCIAQLAIGPWLSTATLGPWDLTWHLTFGDGSKPIWPEEPPYDQIIVLP